MRDQMLRGVLVYHRDDMMRSRARAASVFMHQVGMGSGKPNGCQNQAKSDDEETAYTHIVMLAYLPKRCHSRCGAPPEFERGQAGLTPCCVLLDKDGPYPIGP